MNESPVRSVKDLMLENEALRDENETLFETNNDLIRTVQKLRAELDQAKAENLSLNLKVERQRKMINGVKLNNGKLTLERNELLDELTAIKNMGVWEFANNYCSDEENAEAGHAFARSLLGRSQTDETIAIATKKAYNGDDF